MTENERRELAESERVISERFGGIRPKGGPKYKFGGVNKDTRPPGKVYRFQDLGLTWEEALKWGFHVESWEFLVPYNAQKPLDKEQCNG